MYLLKRIYSKGISKTVYYSHSTMYLLKPFDSETSHLNEVFTFHHVSIKTMDAGQQLPFKVQFTFHHVSIKTFASFVMNLLVFLFTFHHVSIKNLSKLHDDLVARLFTFHHVSIKTRLYYRIRTERTYSHSTMYLLKRLLPVSICYLGRYSHSTMYLLKPLDALTGISPKPNSHSTMYLLKLNYLEFNRFRKTIHIPPCIY